MYWWIARRADVPRPAQTINPAAKLKDTANTEAPQLSFQRKAVQDFHSRQADKNEPPPALSAPVANPPAPSSVNVGLAPQNNHSNSSESPSPRHLVWHIPPRRLIVHLRLAQSKWRLRIMFSPAVTFRNPSSMPTMLQVINLTSFRRCWLLLLVIAEMVRLGSSLVITVSFFYTWYLPCNYYWFHMDFLDYFTGPC